MEEEEQNSGSSNIPVSGSSNPENNGDFGGGDNEVFIAVPAGGGVLGKDNVIRIVNGMWKLEKDLAIRNKEMEELLKTIPDTHDILLQDDVLPQTVDSTKCNPDACRGCGRCGFETLAIGIIHLKALEILLLRELIAYDIMLLDRGSEEEAKKAQTQKISNIRSKIMEREGSNLRRKVKREKLLLEKEKKRKDEELAQELERLKELARRKKQTATEKQKQKEKYKNLWNEGGEPTAKQKKRKVEGATVEGAGLEEEGGNRLGKKQKNVETVETVVAKNLARKSAKSLPEWLPIPESVNKTIGSMNQIDGNDGRYLGEGNYGLSTKMLKLIVAKEIENLQTSGMQKKNNAAWGLTKIKTCNAIIHCLIDLNLLDEKSVIVDWGAGGWSALIQYAVLLAGTRFGGVQLKGFEIAENLVKMARNQLAVLKEMKDNAGNNNYLRELRGTCKPSKSPRSAQFPAVEVPNFGYENVMNRPEKIAAEFLKIIDTQKQKREVGEELVRKMEDIELNILGKKLGAISDIPDPIHVPDGSQTILKFGYEVENPGNTIVVNFDGKGSAAYHIKLAKNIFAYGSGVRVFVSTKLSQGFFKKYVEEHGMNPHGWSHHILEGGDYSTSCLQTHIWYRSSKDCFEDYSRVPKAIPVKKKCGLQCCCE